MPLSLRGCRNVRVYGLTLRDSGGDGIYVAGSGKQLYSKRIHIKDVVCDNNYRQGISVISVDGLLVENCVFRNTWGTPPSSGVDLEPDSADEMLREVIFRNCRFEDNYGDGIEIFLANLTAASGDVSIRFDNCRVTSRRGSGIRVAKVADAGPGGLIEFRDCVVENTEGYGLKVQDKSAARARVKFVSCTVRNAARNRSFDGAWTPIWLHVLRAAGLTTFGGVDFDDCTITDERDRPAIVMQETEGELGLSDVTGTIKIRNPYGVKAELGRKQQGVTLAVTESDA
jgi:hypothetical protein